MTELRLIHNCNHIVTTRDLQVQELSMIKSAGIVDKIYTTSVAGEIIYTKNVKRIISIYSVNNNVFISPEVYSLFSDNSVVWSSTASTMGGVISNSYRVPNVGEEFIIKIQVTAITTSSYISDVVNCPKCAGNNWYIATFDEGYAPSTVYGTLRVAQEFLKTLLTVPNTDRIDSGFGEGFMTETGTLQLDAALEDHIASSITNAGVKCREKQLLDSNRSADETLDSVVITDIQLDDANSGVYVFISLTTVGGKQVALNFKV